MGGWNMRLKEGFVMHNIGGEYMAVSTGELLQDFYGYVRNNETAAEIFKLLQEETTIEKIVDTMYEKYDVEKEILIQDVLEIVGKFREAGFIEE